jgi:hypothetical protein
VKELAAEPLARVRYALIPAAGLRRIRADKLADPEMLMEAALFREDPSAVEDPEQVRETPSWPRSRANFSLLHLHSHRIAWANLHRFGQPDILLSSQDCFRPRSGIGANGQPLQQPPEQPLHLQPPLVLQHSQRHQQHVQLEQHVQHHHQHMRHQQQHVQHAPQEELRPQDRTAFGNERAYSSNYPATDAGSPSRAGAGGLYGNYHSPRRQQHNTAVYGDGSASALQIGSHLRTLVAAHEDR